MINQKRSVALILSLFVLILMGGFVSLAAYQYVADRMIHQHYENSIRGLYAIETARNILNWEESKASPPNSWTTLTGVSGTAPTSGHATFPGAHVFGGFYYLDDLYDGYNVKAKVLVQLGCVYMYIESYKGDEANPQDAQYLEYVHSPSPMYKYAMFSNASLYFSGGKVYDLKGGSIHTNGNLVFYPSADSGGIRLNNVGEISASGAFQYQAVGWAYPAPSILDNLDGDSTGRFRGMTPAPSINSDHFQTTTGASVVPGPFREWSTDSSGVTNLNVKSYADYLVGFWGGSGWWGYSDPNSGNSPMPLIFHGSESFFSGRQSQYGSFWYSWDDGLPQTYGSYPRYLTADGGYSGSSLYRQP